jgi:amino acid transporter
VATTLIFVSISVVTFGVLPGPQLARSTTPMAEVAAVYLPAKAVAFVTLGAIMALCTSLNSTMLVPSRLAVMLAGDGLVPGWIGAVDRRTGTPLWGLLITAASAAGLVLTGQIGLALGIAVQALVILYVLHSYALWALPRRRPDLLAEAAGAPPRRVQRVAAAFSMVSLGGLVLIQVVQDLQVVLGAPALARWGSAGPTSTELLLGWTVVGMTLYRVSQSRR